MADRKLFVGIRIEADRHPELREVARKLKIGADRKELNIKWAPPENWHVTLKFLGPIPSGRIPELAQRLDAAAARCEQADLRMGGVGAFPEERHARVIWVGIARSQPILDLQSVVDDEFRTAGFAPEDREFHPHVTLGRLRSAGTVSDLISPFVRKKFSDTRLRELVLFESIQQGAFPVYVCLHTSLIPPEPAAL